MRKCRGSFGWNQEQLGKRVGLSSSSISLIETGLLKPQQDHAAALDQALEAGGRLLRTWENYSSQGLLPPGFEKYSDLESKALELHEYHGVLVPGLVQTPDYARALVIATQPRATEETIDRFVRTRLERQQAIFERSDRPLVLVVLDEDVVRRVVGDEAVMKAQLEHLIDFAEARKVRLQVVPRSVRFHPGLSGPFRIYVFDGRPTVASCEYFFDEQIIETEAQVRRCVATFDALQGEALPPGSSLDLVRQVLGGLRDGTS
ncbi:DUF5753 domain-containing protein [Streptomonospora nanhaiensis]|uniref:DUF5753 domain-containing protein n=1 Tax=Streptomonospora nanhaiensis TaxID=1323731 RepID=UPI001C99F31F|nr:DUF5753 domain-containing protein [Streptomonospora nanhaiensis]MBX9388322.1 DUF5753 domain-containing protein [Streptomonospora nanhaiensis]